MNATRRTFLGGMAAASALSSATVAVAANAPAPVENPELLAVWDEFTASRAVFQAAADDLQQKKIAYRRIAPPTNPDIVCTERERPWWFRYTEFMRDVTSEYGEDCRADDGSRLRICEVHEINRYHKGGKMPAVVKRLRATVAAHEAAVDEALTVSGLTDALTAYSYAESNMRRVIHQLAQVRARTPAGLGLKVQATATYAALGPSEKYFASIWLANAIWNDLGEDE